MRRRTVLLLALALALALALGAGLLAHAQERSTPKPKGPADAGPVQEPPAGKVVSRQDLGRGTTLARLANGMAVIVREHHVAPVATVRVYVGNTGSAYEGKWLGSGISHLTEHLVSGGSTTHMSETAQEELLGSLGASSNAYTSTDVTCYHIDLPARHVERAVEVLADSMQNCTFPEKEFAREYQVVQRELEMGEEDRSSVLWNMLAELTYREHPLRHPVIGYLPVLRRLTREDVTAFYKERYRPQNMTFVVVGAVKTDAVLGEVSRRFEGFRRTVETPVPMPVEPPPVSPRAATRAMEGDLSTVSIAWPTVGYEHPDAYPLDVAATILGHGDSSRLARNLRFDQTLVVNIGASTHNPTGAPGWLAVTFEAEPKNADKAVGAVLKEVYRLKEAFVAPTELAKAKKQAAAADVFGHQSVEQIAETLAAGYRATGDPLYTTQYVSQIQKVKAEDVLRVAQTYLKPEFVRVATIHPLDHRPAAAEAARPPEAGPVEKHVLANGLTVLIKRSAALPLVSLRCMVRAGVLAESDQTNGVADLTADLLTRGTAKYDADQIAEFFDSVGGSLGSGSDRETTTVSCAVLKEDFPRALDYFAQAVRFPTFPKDEFDARKEEALLNIGQRKADTFTEATEFLHDTMPAGTVWRRIAGGRKETVGPLTPDDCRRFHATYFVPGNMVVTVFGDVDPAQALRLVGEKFGDMKGPPRPPRPEAQGLRLAESLTAHKTTRRQDAAVFILCYPSTDLRQFQDNAALLVIKTILSGYDDAGGWLFHDLRGAGLVYVVQANNNPSLVTGYFAVIGQTRPDQLDEALRRTKALLAKAAAGDVTDEEVAKAKQTLVNAHARENETLADLAEQAAFDELAGRGYDFDKGFEGRINAVTPQDVRAAAKKYLTRCIQVTTGPRPPGS
jgi:zinc protease